MLVSVPELGEILITADWSNCSRTLTNPSAVPEKYSKPSSFKALVCHCVCRRYTQSISIDVICVSIRPKKRVVGKLPILLLFSLQFFFSGAKAQIFPLARSSIQSQPTKWKQHQIRDNMYQNGGSKTGILVSSYKLSFYNVYIGFWGLLTGYMAMALAVPRTQYTIHGSMCQQ